MARDIQVKFRASQEERDRWHDALEGSNKRLSDICRAALNRYAARQKKLKEESK